MSTSTPPPRPDSPPTPPVEDVILPHAVSDDGQGLHVLRKRGDTIEAGLVRGIREGQPIHGELVRLRPREGTPLLDVEVLHDARPPKLGRPPKVATKAFRSGWERVFGAADADAIDATPRDDEEPS